MKWCLYTHTGGLYTHTPVGCTHTKKKQNIRQLYRDFLSFSYFFLSFLLLLGCPPQLFGALLHFVAPESPEGRLCAGRRRFFSPDGHSRSGKYKQEVCCFLFCFCRFLLLLARLFLPSPSRMGLRSPTWAAGVFFSRSIFASADIPGPEHMPLTGLPRWGVHSTAPAGSTQFS